jgi:glycosyltransferase involved in cell wall biosynthesis
MTLKNKIKARIVKNPSLFKILKKIKVNITNTKKQYLKDDFQTWIMNNEPEIWGSAKDLDWQPLISIVVPAFNTPDKYLGPLVQSLKNQTYENWQLCIADASTDQERREAIETISKSDTRINYTYKKGMHISDNTNEGLTLASGEFIGLLDHDDTLSSYALEEVVVAINQNINVDIIYSDEDKLSDDGQERSLPFFKPDWSPDLLLGVNYITHFLVIRKTLVDKVGGLRSKYDGAQDYDLLLRVTEISKNIVHIPKILYHWRLADGSTAKTVGEKNYADNAGQEALRDAVKRRDIKAEVVEITERPTNYRLRYVLPKKQPKVSIIIPFKDKPKLLKQCTDSIFKKTTYENYEIILISNNSVEKDTKELLKSLKLNKRVKLFEWNNPFNFSKITNFGVTKSSGEYIVLLNNDTEVISKDWLDELVGVAIQPGVGAVGPMLLYPEKKNGIQHAGVILGMMGMAGHVFRHRQPDEWTDFGLPNWPRNYLAVTGACLIVSRKLYDEVGGLDETFTVAGNDVAFCLLLHEAGYRNIYWPFVSLYHHESVSVGTYNNGIKLDYEHSLKYYKSYHQSGDPYFNKNLDIMNEQIGLGVQP